MSRITIKRDNDGTVSVTGEPPADNGFYEWALGKVLAGNYTEISWEPYEEGVKVEWKRKKADLEKKS